MFLTTYIKDIESSCLDYSVRQDWFSVWHWVLKYCLLSFFASEQQVQSSLVAVNGKLPLLYAQGFKLYFDTRQTKGFQAYILDYSEHVAFST